MTGVLQDIAEPNSTSMVYVRGDDSAGNVFNTSTLALEAPVAGHVSLYGIAASEWLPGTGKYRALDPIPTVPGWYNLIKIAGSALALGDFSLGMRAEGPAGLDGSNVTQWNGAAVGNDTNGLPSVNVQDIGGVLSAGMNGYVGVDWSKVTNANTAVTLGSTVIGLVGTVQTVNALAANSIGASALSIGALAAIQSGLATASAVVTLQTTTNGINTVVAANLDTNVGSRAPAGTALSTVVWTNALAGYLPNLNVGGLVASHADIVNLNTASPMALLVASPQFQIEATTVLYPIKLYTYSEQGALTDVDGGVGGITSLVTNGAGSDRSANFSGWTHVTTGEYSATYSVTSDATTEPLIISITGVVGGVAFAASTLPIVASAFALAFNSSDRANLTAVFDKLPVNNIADETILLEVLGELGSVSATITAFGPGAITAAAFAAGAITSAAAPALDAPISSRMATFAVPANFGTLGITSTGSLTGDLGGRVLGGSTTVFGGVGAQVDVEQWRGEQPNALVAGGVPLGPITVVYSNGSGSVYVDHNYGGTDALAISQNGVRIEGACITAYRYDDYAANRRDKRYVVATSVTDVNGRWLMPMMLDPATYVLLIYKQHVLAPTPRSLTVTS